MTLRHAGWESRVIYIPFGNGSFSDPTNFAELRYADLGKGEFLPASFRNASMVNGVKWESTVKPDGSLDVYIAWYKQIGFTAPAR